LLDPSNESADPIDGSNQALDLQEIGTYGSGNGAAQVVQLSNGLYAADFSLATGGRGYWEGNETEGIRLVTPGAENLLSSPLAPATSIFDTLGNATSGSPCSIDSPAPNDVSLASGANGTIWVLVAGSDSAAYSGSSIAEFTSDREVIELSPGGAEHCAEPKGTFSLANEGSGSPQSASEALTVPVGSTVDFNASTIEYPTNEGKPSAIYAYEWDPTGEGFSTIEDTIGKRQFQPPATTSYQYTKPGVYPVKLKLLGDFGEYDEEGSVIVQTTTPPKAAFTLPSTAQVGQSVSFTSTSQPASGAQIIDYQWKFGDGTSDETKSATDTHVYAAAGTYTVTLTVRDNDDQSSIPVTQQLTITSPPSTGGGGGNNGGGTTTPTIVTTAAGPPVAVADRSATNVSPNATALKGGAVQVSLSCPATKVYCDGTLEIKTAGAVAAKAKGKKSVLTLGLASFNLTAGTKQTITIKLSSEGAKLLKKDKTLKVDVVVAAHDSYGDPLTKTIALTLHQSAGKAKRK
jgi:PKD repeat protein